MIHRVPLVIIAFIVLWGLVMWALDRTKVDYGFVLSKSGNFNDYSFMSYCLYQLFIIILVTS